MQFAPRGQHCKRSGNAPAGGQATAYIRTSPAIGARCAIGAAVRSAAVMSVPPGQQERQFVVAAVGIQAASWCDAAGQRL